MDDDRVAYGTAHLLRRRLVIITSDTDGCRKSCYSPLHCEYDDIALGHISDHHFVPLRYLGKHVNFCFLMIYFVHVALQCTSMVLALED